MNSNDTQEYAVRFITSGKNQRGFGEFRLSSPSVEMAMERANTVLVGLHGALGRFYITGQEYFIPGVGWGQVFGDKLTEQPRMRRLPTDVVHRIAEVGIQSSTNPDSELIRN